MIETIYNCIVKNFFQNSPYDEDGAQELSDKNFLFNADKKYDSIEGENRSPFAPVFSENFFKENQNVEEEEKKPLKPIMQKRLNDFDGNILRESAVFNFDDKDISIEEKVKVAQELLQSYKEKIAIIEMYGTSPVKNKLISQKEDLEVILGNLNKELQNSSSFGENISLKIDKEKRILMDKIRTFGDAYRRVVKPYEFLHKFFPKLYQTHLLKDSLKKLRKINSLINELAQNQTPYGEGDMKYQSIIAYLSSASSLHSKLRKQIRN